MRNLWWPFAPSVGRYLIKTTAQQTEGRLLQLLVIDGRGAAPPMHIHHDADETFYVIEGELTVFVGDDEIKAGPGDFVLAPKGLPHSFLVISEHAEFLVSFAPAGTRGPSGCGVDGFFADVAVPIVDGVTPPKPMVPDAEEFARRAALYGIEIVGPPPKTDKRSVAESSH